MLNSKEIKNLYGSITKELKNFFDNELSFYAASLSFYTIFAIVPILLIILSIATNLPTFDDYFINIKDFIISNMMPTHTSVVESYLDSFMQNSFSLGAIGLVYVLFASIMFFKNYEFIVAKIFESKKRGFWSGVTTYWTLITLMPIGLLLSSYIGSLVQNFLERFDGGINILSAIPYIMVWFIFFVLFKISSQKEIDLKSALISSFMTSLAWYALKSLFVHYVLYNKAYLTIYGSFSVVLFFFLWIYLSWVVTLYGMRVCSILNRFLGDEKTKDDTSDLKIG